MKYFILFAIIFSYSAMAQNYGSSSPSQGQGSGYSPGQGSSNHSGSFTTPNAGLGEAAPEVSGTGTDINGPATMGQDAYPIDGERTRTTDMTGVNTSSATMDSSNQDLEVPDRYPDGHEHQYGQTGVKDVEKVLDSGKTQTGPYKTHETAIQAEEAKNPKLIHEETPSEMKRKQKGE